MKLARQRPRTRPCWARLLALGAWLALASSLPVGTSMHAQQAAWPPTVRDTAAHEGANVRAKPAAATTTAKAATSEAKQGQSASQSIIALVNDEPITAYELEQRIRYTLLSSPEMRKGLEARAKDPKTNDRFKTFASKQLRDNPPKTEAEARARLEQLRNQFMATIRSEVESSLRAEVRKEALDELINERIQMQEAKRLDVVASEEDVDRQMKGLAERNRMTPKEFAELIAKMGGDISQLRQRIRVSLSWSDVIRRRFGHQITVATRDIDRLAATVEGQDDVDLRVQRILLGLPSDADQKRLAQRLGEAERLRGGFASCATMSALANGVAGARFDDLGERKPTSIPEPTRSLLLNARNEEMLPPTIGEGGVELWAVCSRKTVKPDEQQRQAAEGDLRKKEFDILSKKHLKDLRQDAHIEDRS